MRRFSVPASLLLLLMSVSAATAPLDPPTASPAENVTSAEGPPPGLADRDGDGLSDALQAKFETATPGERFDVIVVYNAPGFRAASARQAVGPFEVSREFRILHGFAATMTAAQATALARTPRIHRIEEDIAISIALDGATEDFGAVAAALDFAVTGSGPGIGRPVGICVLDTGVDGGHEQLNNGHIVDFYDGINGLSVPYDDHGHGTHVASIAAGQGLGGPNAALYRGVAPGAVIFGAKVIDASGSGPDSGVIAGIEWCAAQANVDIISMSLASGIPSDGQDALSLAANCAANPTASPSCAPVGGEPKIVVAAAGNTGPAPATINGPGAAADAIAVGAVAGQSGDGRGIYLSAFSSRGPTLDGRIKPDISAPGMRVKAAQSGTTNKYTNKDGTSMATPFVTGIVALMLDANPDLRFTDPDTGELPFERVRNILEATAHDRGGDGPGGGAKDNEYGAGIVDGYSAVAVASGLGSGDYLPTEFPGHSRELGSVAAGGEWFSAPIEVTGDGTPLAGTVTIAGTSTCIYGSPALCDAFGGWSWDPDLDVELLHADTGTPVAAVGIDITLSECPLSGEYCGAARQETIYYLPTAPGSYQFRVYSFDGAGTFSLDISGIIAGLVANAGPDLTVVDNDNTGFVAVVLDGSNSSQSNGTIDSYEWRVGGSLIATGASPVVNFLVGSHIIVLTVADALGETATDQVVVTVDPNLSPVANAGADQTVSDNDGDLSEAITLDGSGSSDPGGGAIVSYDWFDAGGLVGTGPTINLALGIGTHDFTLTVTDNGDASSGDAVTVTILANQAPVATAGADATLSDLDGDGVETVTLDGSASHDPGGDTSLTYQWSDATGPIGNGPTPDVILATGIHVVSLTVSDQAGVADTDTVTITIQENQAPVADAGVDFTAMDYDNDGFAVVALDGNGSSDPGGAIVTYQWSEGASNLGAGETLSPTLPVGSHTITLTVTDAAGETGADIVTVTVVSDPDAASVVLLLPLEGSDGATSTTDLSPSNHAVNLLGNAEIDTATSSFGASSARFDGSGDYLTVPDSADWSFGSGKFTVEGWIKFNAPASSGILVAHYSNTGNQRSWTFGLQAGVLRFNYSTNGISNGSLEATWSPVPGVWYHLAADRDADDILQIYVDGTILASQDVGAASFFNSNQPLTIGRVFSTTAHYLDGWIDDVRITKGVARYAGGTSFSANSPVKLLSHFDGAAGAKSALDESYQGHVFSFLGNAQIDDAQSRFGVSSARFDGSGDYLTVPDSADWSFGSGEFTVEGWVEFDSPASNGILMAHYLNSGNQRSWTFGLQAGVLRFNYSTNGISNGSLGAPWSPVPGVWYHLAADRDADNVIRIYVDGTILASQDVGAASLFNSNQPLTIGRVFSTTAHYLDGWIDDIRITKGAAQFGGPFTPSAQPLTITLFVPNVVGMDQTAAEADLVAAELAPGSVTSASSETVPSGKVMSQDPIDGANVAVGSAVDLVVSSGPGNAIPVVTAPANVSAEATGPTTAVALGTASATDAEDGALTPTADNLGPYPVGATLVTWSATDNAGNTGSATQTVTVTDTTAPVVTPPADVGAEATGPATAVTLGMASASDLVDGLMTPTANNLGPYPVGVTLVTWSATDNAGNTGSATQTVTVTDTTAPVVTPPADVDAEATGPTTAVALGAASASDLVDGALTPTADNLGPYPVGITLVTWSATDGAGNTGSATQTVTITDTTGPVVTPPADVGAEATGPTTAVALGTASASDLVDGPLTATADNLGPYPVGMTLVTWSATDGAGNTGSATQTVTVTDSGAPVVTAPADVGAEATGPTTAVALGTASATDAEDGPLTPTADNLGPYPVGMTLITWSATDGAGNTGNATQTVTVTDTTAPVVTPPADVGAEATGPTTAVALGAASASDLVDGPLTATADNLGPYPVGITLVTWSATDGAGNTGSATQTVTITDSGAPVVTPPANVGAEATGPTTAVALGTASAGDLVDGALTPTADNLGPYPVGVTLVTWSATDGAGNTGSATQTVTVTDSGAPVVAPPANVSVEATGPTTAVTLGTASAGDLVDGALTATANNLGPYPVGVTLVTWSATDGAGNTGSATQTVTVTDTTAPVVTPPADVGAEATGPTTAVALGTASAGDLVDGALTPTADNLGPYPVGATLVTWSATDGAGNTGSATQTVTVTDSGAPVVTPPADVGAEATGPTTAVALGTASAGDLVDGALTPTADNLGPYSVGVTLVTWSATDGASNTGSATQTVTVTDSGAPVVTLPANVDAEATGPTTAVAIGTASASDLVDGALTPTADNLGPYPVGITLVTWSATDNAGNTDSATQTVTVTDSGAPVVAPPANVSVEATGPATTVALGTANAGDLVDGPLTAIADNLGPYSVGVTLVTWSATDGAGNTGSATQTVAVTDTTAPVVTQPADVGAEATGPTTAVALGTASAGDLVDGALTPTADNLGPYPVGITLVTWSATDNAGNTGSATQTVTITDSGAPVVTAPADVGAEATGPTTAVALGTASATDAEDGPLTATANNLGPYPVGVTLVTWSATDGAGNTGSATQTVTVTDTTAPVVTPPADVGAEATGPATAVTLGTASASDLVDGLMTPTADNLGPYPVGATLVTWSTTDNAGNTGSATQTVTITETASNTPPVADAKIVVTDQDSAVAVTLTGSDGDGDAITFAVASGPSNGSLSGTAPNLTYLPDPGYSGADSFTYTVNDGTVDSAAAVVSITVDPVVGPQEVSFVSIASEDGWVVESGETSAVGGRTNSNNSGSRALRAGDDQRDRQYKFILSFDTAAIPDGASVLSAELRLTRGDDRGTNPFDSHGPLLLDIKLGNFGGSAGLETSDFQDSASATAAVSIADQGGPGTVYVVDFGDNLAHINKAGRTQLRIYFTRDDDDDRTNDYVGFYPADNGTSARHPKLIVTYQE